VLVRCERRASEAFAQRATDGTDGSRPAERAVREVEVLVRCERRASEAVEMELNQFLILSAFLFCVGVYGVLARRNGVLVLMSIELMLNAVNINLIAFSALTKDVSGQVFALFVITIAAAEVGVGLAIVLLIYRNLRTPDLDEVDQLKG
jgi:NADH:ubiquinone oxidoreductase subunit K